MHFATYTEIIYFTFINELNDSSKSVAVMYAKQWNGAEKNRGHYKQSYNF